MVEFAIVLPLLLLLVTGIIQFGLMFNKYITLTDAVRSGARTLALGRGLSNPCDPAVVADAQFRERDRTHRRPGDAKLRVERR